MMTIVTPWQQLLRDTERAGRRAERAAIMTGSGYQQYLAGLENRDRILQALRDAAGPASIADIIDATGLSRSGVYRHLTEMIEAGEAQDCGGHPKRFAGAFCARSPGTKC